jgi:hypothetical protein
MSAHLALGAAAALAGLAALRARQGSRAAVSPLEFVKGRGAPRFAVVSTRSSFQWRPEYRDVGLVQLELGAAVDPAMSEGPTWAAAGPAQRFRRGLTVGYMQVLQTRWQIWEVELVEAQHGYGPLLYDLMMELAHWSGAIGLAPDRSGVSEDAERVWSHYAEQRADVHSSPLPDDYPERDKYSLRWRPHLDRVYARSDVSGLRTLVERGRLQIYDPGHVLDPDYDELDIKMSATDAEPQR